MSGYLSPWMQPAMGYTESGYVDPLANRQGMWPEMRYGGSPQAGMSGNSPLVPSAVSDPMTSPLVPSDPANWMSSVPQRTTLQAFGHDTMKNIMNPGIGNVAMAALPMIQGDFSPESIGQGAGSYLGGAAGGAAAGALSGTAAGAAMGSVLPGIGTVIGAGLGSLAGGEIGGLFGDSKAEKEEKKQKKQAQYQWLGNAISNFSSEISMRGQERRGAIDSINQYLAGGNAQRAQMRPY